MAEPKWDKEHVERAAQGLPPRFNKYGDKPTDNYVRARYKVNPVTGGIATDPKVRQLERLLVNNTSPCLISSIWLHFKIINEAKFLNGSRVPCAGN